MRHKIFERRRRVDDDFSDFAAALVFDVSERHSEDFFDAFFSDIRHRPKRPDMRATKCAKIHAHSVDGIFYGVKTVVFDVLGFGEIGHYR